MVEDRIEGRKEHAIESRLHVHPDLAIILENNIATISDAQGALLKVSSADVGTMTLESGWYCEEFGAARQCPVLSIREDSVVLPFQCSWRLALAMAR